MFLLAFATTAFIRKFSLLVDNQWYLALSHSKSSNDCNVPIGFTIDEYHNTMNNINCVTMHGVTVSWIM